MSDAGNQEDLMRFAGRLRLMGMVLSVVGAVVLVMKDSTSIDLQTLLGVAMVASGAPAGLVGQHLFRVLLQHRDGDQLY